MAKPKIAKSSKKTVAGPKPTASGKVSPVKTRKKAMEKKTSKNVVALPTEAVSETPTRVQKKTRSLRKSAAPESETAPSYSPEGTNVTAATQQVQTSPVPFSADLQTNDADRRAAVELVVPPKKNKKLTLREELKSLQQEVSFTKEKDLTNIELARSLLERLSVRIATLFLKNVT